MTDLKVLVKAEICIDEKFRETTENGKSDSLAEKI
jgi:hypothetical protein